MAYGRYEIIYAYMATVINNPSVERESAGSGAGWTLAIILVVLVAALLILFGLPALNNTPADTGTDVNLPDEVNVNVGEGGTTGQ